MKSIEARLDRIEAKAGMRGTWPERMHVVIMRRGEDEGQAIQRHATENPDSSFLRDVERDKACCVPAVLFVRIMPATRSAEVAA